ncbi:MAG: VWA domain-containing protein [Deltaproteobacteria bacterium]|nr:VWA domain-containing protein [Nannocystaceae bacterium]
MAASFAASILSVMSTPFELRAYAEHKNVEPGTSTLWAAIRVDPKGKALETDRAPLAIALVIDTSGSMQGDPIAHARAAARKVVETMADGDLLGLVTFDSHARTLIEPVVLGPQTRRRALATIAELRADGGTALHDGVKLAELSLLHAPEEYLVKRVVVISDGQATAGPTDPEVLGNLAEVGMGHGIQVTALGVGLDYDEHTLDAFAVRSSGRLYHIESSKEMPSMIVRELELLASSSAALAELEIVPARGVTILGADAVRASGGGKAGLRVPLGVMFAGQQREVLVRVRVDRRTHGDHALASVRLRFRDPGDDGIERVQESLVRATVTDDPRMVAEHENDRAQTIIAMREASMLAAQASRSATDGDLELATADLDRAEQSLRDKAVHMKDEKQRRQVISNAEQLGRAKKKVQEAAEAPAAARATKSRAAALDANDAFMSLDGF